MTENDLDKSHLTAAKAEFRKAVIGSLSGIEIMQILAKYLYADPYEYLRINRLKEDYPRLSEKLVSKSCDEKIEPVNQSSLWPGI